MRLALPGCRLLDLCSGPGYVANQARRREAVPTGLDFSEEMIAIAKQRFPEIQFQAGRPMDRHSVPAGFSWGYAALRGRSYYCP
jgi:trans-aconitate methyltransferase